MAPSPLYRPSGLYVVTPKGHADRQELPTCLCQPKLVGLLFECPECGTIWGSLREQVGFAPGANRKPD